MKKSLLQLLFMILPIAIGGCLYMYFTGQYYYFNFSEMKNDKPATLYLTDSNSSSTIVTPVLNAKIDPLKNMIFCSSVQMAWNDLINNFFKDSIEVENAPEYLYELNALKDQKPLLSDDAYLIISGIADYSTNSKIIKSLKEKFGNMLPMNELNIPLNIAKGNLFAFAFLLKILKFQKEFNKINKHHFYFDNQKKIVKAFGIEDSTDTAGNQKLIKQIEVFHDSKYDTGFIPEFVIKFISNSKSDEIIISNFKPEATLEKTYFKIKNYILKPENYIKIPPRVHIAIPKINFDININYQKLCGKIKNHDDYTINTVFQKIQFELNEKGVILKSYSLISVSTGMPISYIIKGPFFIYLKDKNHDLPYFMAYIANDELLVKSN